MKVQRCGGTAGVVGKEIQVQGTRNRHSIDNAVDHDADLKHPLHETDQIASALLGGVVREAPLENRQHDEEAGAIAVATVENKFWTSR